MDKIVAWIKMFWTGVTKAFPTSVNDQITDSVTQVGPEKKPTPKKPKTTKAKDAKPATKAKKVK